METELPALEAKVAELEKSLETSDTRWRALSEEIERLRTKLGIEA